MSTGPAIAVVIPTKRLPSVLLDAGANADARPEHLFQFAYMGAVFAEEILGIERPRVRLLSIGEEPEKGNQLTLDAHALLLEGAGLRFEGNTEGRTLLEGEADVIVTDGFTGNVALKTLEGTIGSVLAALRSDIEASARGKLGGALIRPATRHLRERLDPGDPRRCLPARAQRACCDRPRIQLPQGDRQCDPPGGTRGGARRRRQARAATAGPDRCTRGVSSSVERPRPARAEPSVACREAIHGLCDRAAKAELVVNHGFRRDEVVESPVNRPRPPKVRFASGSVP